MHSNVSSFCPPLSLRISCPQIVPEEAYIYVNVTECIHGAIVGATATGRRDVRSETPTAVVATISPCKRPITVD